MLADIVSATERSPHPRAPSSDYKSCWPERIDVTDVVHDHNQEEHRARYVWAAERASGRVLDIACGTGHGSELLARRCHLSGLDKDNTAISAAKARVPSGEFRVCHVPPVPFDDNSFDTAVSFETLEHVDRDRDFLLELRRIVKPGGHLLVSSPNRAVTSPNAEVPPNPFHVREYLLPDLLSRVREAGFGEVDVWYQRRERRAVREHLARAVIARLPRLCRPGRWWDELGHGSGSVEHWTADVRQPLLWVLDCS